MVFSSIFFIFYFLPAILAVYFLAPKRHRNLVLFLGSLIFYAWGEPVYVALMLFSTAFNYFAGRKIGRTEQQVQKKRVLTISVVVNLAILVFFKYTNFFLGLINAALPWDIPYLNLALPIGISFYTFQTMSYVIDVYRGKVAAQKNFINFGTYVTLFPQLIAGPIVRYSTIEKQLTSRRETIEGFSSGLMCFAAGLAKKVLIANNIGLLWDSVHATALPELSALSAWLGIIAFAFQIYFDFSGYSDMAIGLGRMFGFEFEQNFNYPYISKSITDFWRRWHISLSTWFKEYVYIPLGGNRAGRGRAHLNILIVWVLTGFWHGASFNFLAWGLYYALLLMLEKDVLAKLLNKLPKAVGTVYTLFFVLIGWVLFASDSLTESIGYLKLMFGFSGAGAVSPMFFYDVLSNMVLLVIAAAASLPFGAKIGRRFVQKSPAAAVIPVAVALILCTAYLVDAGYNPFLYFRF
ncbi:MBOAT family O-acyltransferase [Congzhengia minquanensis]|uniref:MBOAT family protein n=1 Tax=Congzhengia minquanensis TaxID=2763657 RepID=A0A926HX57_9FIRM|nr:MBOAT family O-acyltransferase [Congzhengia minquanensis]MBC8539704.1 MBOAT family protein [Congzhengia minquanensis]